MAFKDTWKPRIDGVDDVDSSAVNEIAEAVIEMDEHKQEALTDRQLQNIEDVPKKTDKEYVDNNFANALKGSAFGQNVTLDDISPVEHTVDVTVKSKNILSAVIYKDASPNGVTVSGSMKIEKEKLYTISFDTLNTGATLWIALSINYRIPVSGQTVAKKCDGTKQSFIFQAKDDFILNNIALVQVNTASPVGVTKGDIYNLMIEEGTVATEYTDYVADIPGRRIEIQIPNDNGYNEIVEEPVLDENGACSVKSRYPSMRVYAMNDGLIADITYNRDINKAFAELEEKLTNAIISLGGNV